jgi:hypothetical protein
LADPEYGFSLAKALAVNLDQVQKISKLGYAERLKALGLKTD